MVQPPFDHVFVQRTKSKAAAGVRTGAGLPLRERAELLGLLRPCFARTEPWLQAAKYVAALVSELARVNAWSIARHAGDRTPDKTQRLLNHAAWDTSATMSGYAASRWPGWRRPPAPATTHVLARLAGQWRLRGGPDAPRRLEDAGDAHPLRGQGRRRTRAGCSQAPVPRRPL